MPLFWLSLAFLAGILLSSVTSFSIAGWLIIAILPLLLLFPPIYYVWSPLIPPHLTSLARSFRISSPSLYPLLVICLSVGAIRYTTTRPEINPSFIAYYNDQPAEHIVEGVLVDLPDVRDTYTNLRLRIDTLRPAGNGSDLTVKGLLLARVTTRTYYQYGDRLQLQGRLETPSENEDFSYRDYLAQRGIYSTMRSDEVILIQHGQGNPVYSLLYAIRERFLRLIYRFLPDPEASLLAGILLGVQSGISPAVQEAFRLTGTSHIIVISGFNITMIAMMFTFLFSGLLGSRKGMLITAFGIIFYTLLVGANPAVVRAAALGLLTLLGRQLGRQQTGLNSLAIIAAGMAWFTPTVLWDVSFQLSFAATLGIMLYAEPFTRAFINFAARFSSRDKIEKLAGPVGEYLLLTLAAQLTTLPLMAFYFKRFSLTALIANPLILPAQLPLMVLGGLSVLSGLIFLPLGQLFAWAAWPFTAYTIRVVEWLAAVPHGSIPLGQVALPFILFFYTILFGITFARSHLSSLAHRLTPVIPLGFLAVITVLVWKAGFYAPDGRLQATILNVGTGDAVLINTPTGRSVLINGGPSTLSLSNTLGRRLSPFHRTLDWLVIADIENEDLSGISANLERFPPSNVLWAGNTYASRASADLWSRLIALKIPALPMQTGQSLELGSGATLQVLSTNDRGAVLLLEWKSFRLLLPMAEDFDSITMLEKNLTMRSISAVLLAESGYAPLNPPDFISFLHPQLALLSVAPADKSGLPSPETLDALQGYNLLRTDQNGGIELTTDGSQMWVEVERK